MIHPAFPQPLSESSLKRSTITLNSIINTLMKTNVTKISQIASQIENAGMSPPVMSRRRTVVGIPPVEALDQGASFACALTA